MGSDKEVKSEVQITELFEEFEFETPSPYPDSPVCPSPAPSDKQPDRLQKKKPKKQPTPSPELVKAQVRLSQLQGQVHSKSRELDELRQANQELTYAIKVKDDKLVNKRPTYSALKGFQRQRQELTAERDLALARLQEAVQRASLAEQLASDALRDREEALGEREKLTKERDYAAKLYETLRRSVDVEDDSEFPLSIRKTVDRQVQTYLSLVHRKGSGGAFNTMFPGAGADGISEGPSFPSGNRRDPKVVQKISFSSNGSSEVNNDEAKNISKDCTADFESSGKGNGTTASGDGRESEETVHPWLVSAGRGHGVRVMSPHPAEYKSMLRGNAQPKVMFRSFRSNAT
ncbi:PREDICTED: uncharacterized protein LOC109481951 [Branchiostoma belcheri]|uniref:Uncharacterized protein LOC109481951 n=1 Tax=Branchiostoma belcheri TaxID=7741 RepID=A0A6P5A9U7_BRABE|nr:PREDICTED: uncharacterized protein LOC109481951 [Branchiostoma belcheri]